MSLFGDLVKGVLAGSGWTAGKAVADTAIDKVKQKFGEKPEEQPEKSEEEALEDLEVPPEEEEDKK